MYEELGNVIEKIKEDENLIVLGDWNVTVGEGRENSIVCKYGTGKRNERVERLIEFCYRLKLIVTNTHVQHHPRRRNT